VPGRSGAFRFSTILAVRLTVGIPISWSAVEVFWYPDAASEDTITLRGTTWVPE
jgi:uncharacterized membrane protein YciS (DUF1049 family)